MRGGDGGAGWGNGKQAGVVGQARFRLEGKASRQPFDPGSPLSAFDLLPSPPAALHNLDAQQTHHCLRDTPQLGILLPSADLTAFLPSPFQCPGVSLGSFNCSLGSTYRLSGQQMSKSAASSPLYLSTQRLYLSSQGRR